jgi:hypothetical protein
MMTSTRTARVGSDCESITVREDGCRAVHGQGRDPRATQRYGEASG